MTVTLKMVFVTVIKEYIYILNMAQKKEKRINMKELGQITSKMGLELKHILDQEDIKAIGKMEKDMEKEFLFMIIKIYTQANGKMEKKMGKAHTFLKRRE
jgi:hypothetical protein